MTQQTGLLIAQTHKGHADKRSRRSKTRKSYAKVRPNRYGLTQII